MKSLWQNFSNPPVEFRQIPFWSLNEKFNLKEMYRQIDTMANAGYGGFFMHSRVGLVTKYLSDEWFALIKACAKYASQKGLKVWLYDEDMWPSGYASGLVTKANADYKLQHMVLVSESEIQAGDKPFARLDEYGKSIVIRYMPDTFRFNGGAYLDVFNPNAVNKFLEVTHERYKQEMGEMFGKEIVGIFTDEPTFNIEFFGFEPHLPYSPYLLEFFKKEKGYDICDRLDELFFDVGDYKKTRYDYHNACNELFLKNFIERYHSWCMANSLVFTGHFACEDSMLDMALNQGSCMPGYECMDVPCIDKLQRPLSQLTTVKQVASAAAQLGKNTVLCECFAGIGNEAGFVGRKRISDWLTVLGINAYNPHLTPYSLRGERKRDYPPALSYHQPYFMHEKAYSDYLARLSVLMRGSKRKTKILLLQPMSTVYSNFKPRDTERIKDLDERFTALSKLLTETGVDYDYGDDVLIGKYGRIKDGKFIVGECEYDTVICAYAENLASKTLELLNDFSKSGELICVGDEPSLSDGVKSQTELCFRHTFTTNEALADMLSKDVRILPCEHLLYVEKALGDDEIIFACNTSKEQAATVKFAAAEEKYIYAVNLSEGKIHLLSDGKSGVPRITLQPYGSVMLLIGKERVAEELPISLKDGALFGDYRAIEGLTLTAVDKTNPNVLPVRRANLYIDSKLIGKNMHVSEIWHEHFYPLKDGTDFSLEYCFNLLKIPEGEIFAVIENAENLDKITVNGVEVKPMREKGESQVVDEKAFIDVSFTRVNITSTLLSGENIIKIYGKKVNNITGICMHCTVENHKEHNPTEAEAIYIVGEFAVDENNNICPKTSISSDYPNKYPYYAGSVVYETNEFTVEENTYLSLEGVNAASVELSTNGAPIGVLICPPYIFNLSKLKGQRVRLQLKVTGTLYNLLGPDYIEGYNDLLWVDPNVFCDKSKLSQSSNLIKYSIGEAKIIKKA